MAELPEVARLEPVPGPVNQEFYDGLKRHELLLQKCTDCGKFRFWPIEMCPFCNSFNYEWARCSGKGTVNSYTIQHATMPYPWPVLLVELEEGPRLITHGLMSPEEVQIGMPVEVDYEKLSDEMTLHAFKKAKK
jgi:uncharacterized OB-fold protein